MLFRIQSALLTSLTVVTLGSRVALPVLAQGRPTLQFLTDSVCKMADVEQMDYRPAVCEARCDCFKGTDLST